jgi:5-methylcytosine-specific restriction endonuclease McrA
MAELRRLSAAPSVRLAVERRSGGACESCGFAWPWALSLFRLEEAGPNTAENLVALCLRCSDGREGASAPLIGSRTTRARLQTANNRRAAARPLTEGRRRALIASRGGRCEICGAAAEQRRLEVHHRVPVLQGGHDGDDNLQVLCFACHRNLEPCATGCGAWARRGRRACRHCLTRSALERLLPEASWEEIKLRFPSFVQQWKPGYEPRPLPQSFSSRREV